MFGLYGGDKRDRTADLLNAIQALSQLSYTPILFTVQTSVAQRKMYNTRTTRICQQEISTFFFFLFCFFISLSVCIQHCPAERSAQPGRCAFADYSSILPSTSLMT